MAVGVPGVALPIDLQSIKFAVAFVEVGEGMLNVHAMCSKVYNEAVGILKEKK